MFAGVLPSFTEIVAILKDDWQRLDMLLDTCKDDELLSTDAEQMLTRLFHEENCRLQEPKAVQFSCDCSRERSAGAIKSLGTEEIKAIMSEQDVVSIDCHFCFQRYDFDHPALSKLIQEMSDS